MLVERKPQNATKMHAVWQALASGQSRLAIGPFLGLAKREVSTIISNLRKEGYLPKPTPDETKRSMQESVSEAGGGIWLLIEPFVKLGMSPLEIKAAVFLEKGKELGRVQIANALNKARKRGDVRNPTRGEKQDVRREVVRGSFDQIQKRVLLWLDAQEVADNLANGKKFNGRLEWAHWIAECKRTGLISEDALDWRIKVRLGPIRSGEEPEFLKEATRNLEPETKLEFQKAIDSIYKLPTSWRNKEALIFFSVYYYNALGNSADALGISYRMAKKYLHMVLAEEQLIKNWEAVMGTGGNS